MKIKAFEKYFLENIFSILCAQPRGDILLPSKAKGKSPMTVKNIEKTILRLSPIERIRIVENILASLDTPDPGIERAWGLESDKRLAAYKNGKVKGISADAVKKRLAG